MLAEGKNWLLKSQDFTLRCYHIYVLFERLQSGGGTELRFFSLCGNSANHHATTAYQQSANKKCIKSEWYVVWNMQTIVQMKTALLKVVHLILIMVCMLWAWELLQRTSVLSTQYFFPCLKINKWMKKKSLTSKNKISYFHNDTTLGHLPNAMV